MKDLSYLWKMMLKVFVHESEALGYIEAPGNGMFVNQFSKVVFTKGFKKILQFLSGQIPLISKFQKRYRGWSMLNQQFWCGKPEWQTLGNFQQKESEGGAQPGIIQLLYTLRFFLQIEQSKALGREQMNEDLVHRPLVCTGFLRESNFGISQQLFEQVVSGLL